MKKEVGSEKEEEGEKVEGEVEVEKKKKEEEEQEEKEVEEEEIKGKEGSTGCLKSRKYPTIYRSFCPRKSIRNI